MSQPNTPPVADTSSRPTTWNRPEYRREPVMTSSCPSGRWLPGLKVTHDLEGCWFPSWTDIEDREVLYDDVWQCGCGKLYQMTMDDAGRPHWRRVRVEGVEDDQGDVDRDALLELHRELRVEILPVEELDSLGRQDRRLGDSATERSGLLRDVVARLAAALGLEGQD